jgi:predicted dehydrogenase
VIGTGGMGTGHCNTIPTLEEVELAAVCDIVPEVAQSTAAKFGVPGFTNHLELLDSGLVDMVIVATPHYFHPTIAVDAFERGIHVLSEKPITVTVSDADRMIAAAKKSGLKFGVMFQMRTNTRNIAAKKIIDEGRLGEIYRTALIMGWYRSQAYYDSGTWRATWAGEGGGVLINQAPHLLDLFTWLAGLPKVVTAQVNTRIHDIEVEDEAIAVLEYPNGAHGYLYASVTEVPGEETLEICGEKGKLVIRDGQLRLWELEMPRKQFTVENTEMWGSPKSVEVPLDVPPGHDSHGEITSNFARAILNDEPLISPGEEGLRAVEMINSIILSGKRGKPVTLPVDRAEYDTLIEELKKTSRVKSRVSEQRVTDPKFG